MVWIFPVAVGVFWIWQFDALSVQMSVSLASTITCLCIAALQTNSSFRREFILAGGLVFVLVTAFAWRLQMSLAEAVVIGSVAFMGLALLQSAPRITDAGIAIVIPLATWLAAHSTLLFLQDMHFDLVLWGLAAAAAGALVGWLAKVMIGGNANPTEDVDELLNDAVKALADVRLTHARRQLAKALRLAPDRLDVIRANYAAWKYEPTHDEFHRAAEELFRRIDDDEALLNVYKDYLAVTQVRPRVELGLHLSMAERFADLGEPDDAARIVNVYLQRDIESPAMIRTLLALMRSYDAADNAHRAIRYADTIVGLYPRSSAAKLALNLISKRRGA